MNPARDGKNAQQAPASYHQSPNFLIPMGGREEGEKAVDGPGCPMGTFATPKLS